MLTMLMIIIIQSLSLTLTSISIQYLLSERFSFVVFVCVWFLQKKKIPYKLQRFSPHTYKHTHKHTDTKLSFLVIHAHTRTHVPTYKTQTDRLANGQTDRHICKQKSTLFLFDVTSIHEQIKKKNIVHTVHDNRFSKLN